MATSVSASALSTFSGSEVPDEAVASALRPWREQAPTLISMNDVCAMTSLSRTFINKRRAEGQFPEPVPLGEKRFAFVRAEIVEWIAERIAERIASSRSGRGQKAA